LCVCVKQKLSQYLVYLHAVPVGTWIGKTDSPCRPSNVQVMLYLRLIYLQENYVTYGIYLSLYSPCLSSPHSHYPFWHSFCLYHDCKMTVLAILAFTINMAEAQMLYPLCILIVSVPVLYLQFLSHLQSQVGVFIQTRWISNLIYNYVYMSLLNATSDFILCQPSSKEILYQEQELKRNITIAEYKVSHSPVVTILTACRDSVLTLKSCVIIKHGQKVKLVWKECVNADRSNNTKTVPLQHM